jgi:hypothetical protein
MILGHIKSLERPGDRAIEYAKGVKGLLEADSGLVDWQMKVIYRKGQFPSQSKGRMSRLYDYDSRRLSVA